MSHPSKTKELYGKGSRMDDVKAEDGQMCSTKASSGHDTIVSLMHPLQCYSLQRIRLLNSPSWMAEESVMMSLFSTSYQTVWKN